MTPSKIVILEADQQRRDYIRSLVSDRGYVPYIFEKETICLDNLLLLKTEMGAGHAGPSGRYSGLRELAFEYAFTLQRLS